MGIFDSNKKEYLNYFVHLTDPAAVEAAQAAFPNGRNLAITNRAGANPAGYAVTIYDAPFRGYTEPAASSAPFIWTPWSGIGEEDGPFPLHVATFRRKTGGFFGIGGTEIQYYWMAQFVLAADPDSPPDGGDADDEADIPVRRWIEGFEMPEMGGTTSFGTGLAASKDASRHVGGQGLAFRGATNQSMLVSLSKYGAVTSSQSWERFYIRLRQLPAETTYFWRWVGTPSPGVGQLLGVSATGNLILANSSASSVITIVGAIPDVTLEAWDGTSGSNAWHKIDVVLDTHVSASAGEIKVYVDGVLRYTGAAPEATGHTGSRIGNPISFVNDLYLDIDDWHNAEIPERGGVPAFNGKDFYNGTKIVLVRANGFAATHDAGDWAGDFRQLLQNGHGVVRTGSGLISTTASADIAVETDAEGPVDADPGSLGPVAINVGVTSKRGTTSGQLGYSLAGGAAVMTNITEQTSLSPQGILASLDTTTASGSPALQDITPLELYYKKGADASSGEVTALMAQVQLAGLWGPEDYHPDLLGDIEIEPAGAMGSHNSPYPRSPWARRGLAPPIAPYVVTAGTYTGNDTGQDLLFSAPVHWLWIRPLTSPAGGFQWWSTHLASHKAYEQGIYPAACNADEDPDFAPATGEEAQQQRYRVRIAGNDTQINDLGVTYQYIAVSDPGGRFMLNGTMSHKNGGATVSTPLIDADFDPGFMFLWVENNSSTTTSRLYAKHTDTAAATIVGISPATVANALTMAQGSLESQSALHSLGSGYAYPYSLWRRSDGNQDTGEAAAVCFGSYVGDGTASRTINFSPATGKRPIFAMVFAESAGSGMTRDPSNTGTTSNTHTGIANASTGITAGGIDSMSVGSILNTNGVRFIYFVLFGDATAGENGWGVNGEFVPVEPSSGTGTQWPVPVEPVEEPDEDDDGQPSTGPPDADDSIEFTGLCGQWSTFLVNIALSRIGISKSIDDIATDVTEEAYQARLHFILDMDHTLRDYPWSFATRYADLVLVEGSEEEPVNKDWTYSYRAPTSMVFARRLVGQAGQKRAYDPNPPKFALGSDTTGTLIFANEAASDDVPLQLEYTFRLPCPGQLGDPIFRSACAWKLASSLALPLARDAKKAEYCEAMYRDVLNQARATDAKEEQQEPDGDAAWITGRN